MLAGLGVASRGAGSRGGPSGLRRSTGRPDGSIRHQRRSGPTGVLTASTAIIAGVATITAAASYPVVKMYEYEAGVIGEYDIVEHVSSVLAAPFSSIALSSVGSMGDVIDEISSQITEYAVEMGVSETIRNAQKYDPWVEEHYYNQPMTSIYDWDQAEKNRY